MPIQPFIRNLIVLQFLNVTASLFLYYNIFTDQEMCSYYSIASLSFTASKPLIVLTFQGDLYE